MITIEMPKFENDLDELVSSLPIETYKVVIPKNFDGAEVLQVVIRMAEITLPLIFAYLMSTKKKNTIVVKYKGKVDVEITAELRKLEPDADKILKSLERKVEEFGIGDGNETDN